MKMKHTIQSCMMLLLGLTSVDSAVALQWPVQMEGTATTKNVIFESFLRKT